MSRAKHFAYLTDATFHDPKQLASAIWRLHRQFGHTSPARLAKTILRVYPEVDKRTLAAIVDMFTCEVCGKHVKLVKRLLASKLGQISSGLT